MKQIKYPIMIHVNTVYEKVIKAKDANSAREKAGRLKPKDLKKKEIVATEIDFVEV